MKRFISNRLTKIVVYTLVIVLVYGPVVNLDAASSAQSKTSCPTETQQCLTDPNSRLKEKL